MALTCDAPSLSLASSNLSQTLTHKQLLAALLYVLCTANGMNCTPQSLVAASNCLSCAMTEKQLIAALLFVQCSTGGGGGGGGGGTTGQLMVYTGATPTADGLVPANINLPAEAYKFDGSDATYTWNTTTHVWNP